MDNIFDEYLVAIKPAIDKNAWGNVFGNIKDGANNFIDDIKNLFNSIDDVNVKANVKIDKKGITDEIRDAIGKAQKLKNIDKEYYEIEENIKEAQGKKSRIIDRLKQKGTTDEERIYLRSQIKELNESIKSQQNNLFKLKLDRETAPQLTGRDKQLLDLSSKASGLIKGIGKAAGYITIIISLIKESIDIGEKVIEQGKELSNSLVTSKSIFVDQDVKSIMASMGVDTETAQGMSFALDNLGISMSDLQIATGGQRKAFMYLTNEYKELMRNIKDEDLASYNEMMQQYQLKEIEIRMRMRVALIKLFAESEAIPRLVDDFSNMMQGLSDILSSPVVKFGMETFLSFVEALVSIVSTPISWAGKLFGGTTNNTTTNTDNSVVTTNNYYGGSSSYVKFGVNYGLNG